MKFDERGRKSVIVPSNVYRYVDTKKETDKKMHESVIVESTQKNGVENPVVMAMSMIETTKPNTSTRPAPKIV